MRRDILSFRFVLVFLSTTCTLAIPIAEETKSVAEIHVHTPPKNINNAPYKKLRQDGEDAEEAVGGLQAVAGPISQIISGTLSGNFDQLFKGVTGTVADQDVRPGVGTILSGVSAPLTALWKQGVAAGQKYFNITTSPPPLAAGVAPAALPQGSPQAAPVQTVAVAAPQPAQVVAESVTDAPVVQTTPEDDDDEESQRDINKNT